MTNLSTPSSTRGRFALRVLIHAAFVCHVPSILNPTPTPPQDEENIEALCKLVATIGAQIDHALAKNHVDAYMSRMHALSTNQAISSRIRFMLRDVVELRQNDWQVGSGGKEWVGE